jgi:ferric-dicitrate binding protein FerR (iron transport regulator)
MVVPVLRRYTLIGAAAALALVTPNLDASTTQGVQGATPLPKELQQTQKDFRDDVPAHISVVDGQAELEHDGKIERAEANMLLLAGDRLRTTRGRLEVLFDDGSALHLDENSTVDLLSESLIRLRMGRLRLLVARTSNPIEYRIEAAAG